MRRVLVDRARAKGRQKRGGNASRVDLEDDMWIATTPPDEILAIDESLTKLAQEDAAAAEVVKLRYFAGMTVAEALAIHRTTAHRHWTFARAWIRAEFRANRSLEKE